MRDRIVGEKTLVEAARTGQEIVYRLLGIHERLEEIPEHVRPFVAKLLRAVADQLDREEEKP
jgi:hypothetical protein